jgi:hypothetical protein
MTEWGAFPSLSPIDIETVNYMTSTFPFTLSLLCKFIFSRFGRSRISIVDVVAV